MAKRKKHAKKARLARLAIWVIALAMAMTGVTLPAAAQTPPFEVVFPQDVAATSFIDSWGYPRSGGRRHKGTDLMAPKMTEVYAVSDGVVDKVGKGRLAGRYVRIRHEGGWTSYYMHLNNDLPGSDDGAAPWFTTVAPGVFEGAEITAGQLLGWVGDSGNAENTAPPHSLRAPQERCGGQPVPDPQTSLRRSCRPTGRDA